MSRGRQLKTKVREAKKIAEATVKATEKAKQEVLNKKPLSLFFKEAFAKMLDRIDPMEAVAVIGTTLALANLKEWVDHLKTGMIQIRGAMRGTDPMAQFYPTEIKLSEWSPYDMPFEQWVITFTVAYLIVHNFGYIVQTTGKITSDLLGMSKALLPMVPVPP